MDFMCLHVAHININKIYHIKIKYMIYDSLNVITLINHKNH